MSGEKTAVLVVSFGTSHKEARKKTIDKIEREIQDAYPEVPVYRAWTSRVLLKKLKDEEHLSYDNVCQAMQRIAEAGVKNVVVQPTHMMDGIENDRMKADVLKFSEKFEQIAIGAPLFMSAKDLEKTMQAIMEEFGRLGENEALVLIGHGTSHSANAVYTTLAALFQGSGYKNVFVGTVEGYPELPDVIEFIKRGDFSRVHMMPLMLVAGEHARNDMAGEDDASWKSHFEKEGYEVLCHIKGLGEYSGIRRIFLDHLESAGKTVLS